MTLYRSCPYRKGMPKVASEVCEECTNAKCRKERRKIVRQLIKIGKGLKALEEHKVEIPITSSFRGAPTGPDF